jgi:hypothetical protein
MDAAVAVGYALAVVYPAAGNLGGGGFMTVQFADGRKTFIDFRETAPRAATATMYLDAQGNVIPDLSTRGHLAVAVPGTVSGLEYVRAKYGTLPRAVLIAPAIGLAERGFVLAQGDVDILHEGSDDFRKDAASAAVFLAGGQPLEAGATLIQKDLARATGFSRRPISTPINPASSPRSNATIAASTSSPRPRPLRAASRCAKCSTCSRVIRCANTDTVRRAPFTSRSRRCATPTWIATTCWAIRPSCVIHSRS